ncbi:efflux transporter outer membrane subunit [Thermopirellula anaerolimosa]
MDPISAARKMGEGEDREGGRGMRSRREPTSWTDPGVERTTRIVAILTVLLFAAGCMTSFREWINNGFKVGPNYCPPGAEVGEAFLDSSDPGISTGAADYGEWWSVFNDPTLNELVRTAYEENLPLKIAAERILEAQAMLGVARGSWWPQQQQAMGSFSRNQMSGEAFPMSNFSKIPGFKMAYDDWALGAEMAWELDFWGRFRRMIESAEANVEAEEEAYNAALVLLQAETASTYIQLRTIDERLALAQQNVALQKNTLTIAQARFEQGVVSQLDVHQAQAILANTEALIPMLRSLRRVAENRLCTLLGEPPQDLDPILGPSGKIPEAPADVVVGIPADLLRRRPDVKRAERLAAAQCARIGIAEAEFYPHIALTGQIAYQAENFSDLFGGKSFSGMIGPGFRWNILNYGRIRNSVLMEDARFRQAVLGYQEAVLRANEEAEDMITAFLEEKRRLIALEQATQATAAASALAMAQYQEGLIDFQRVIDSQRALVQQQDALAESRGKVALNLVSVYKALGGGWEVRYRPTATRVVSYTTTETGGSGQGLDTAPQPALPVVPAAPATPATPGVIAPPAGAVPQPMPPANTAAPPPVQQAPQAVPPAESPAPQGGSPSPMPLPPAPAPDEPAEVQFQQ